MSLEILRVHYPTLNMKFSVFPRYQTENSFCYMKYVIVISLLKIWVKTFPHDRWRELSLMIDVEFMNKKVDPRKSYMNCEMHIISCIKIKAHIFLHEIWYSQMNVRI